MRREYLTIEEAKHEREAALAEWREREPAWFDDPSSLIGTTFCHDNQPYGAVYFVVESAEPIAAPEEEGPRYGTVPSTAYMCHRAAGGWWELRGTVTKGGVRSRLLQHVGFGSLVGEPYSIQTPPDALARGVYVTVAM